jgi:hypothetical protein
MFQAAGYGSGQCMQLLNSSLDKVCAEGKVFSCLPGYLAACGEYGINVACVPTYSPTSIAENALALLFALNMYVC